MSKWEEFQCIFESHVSFRLGEMILLCSLLKESDMLKFSWRNSLCERILGCTLVLYLLRTNEGWNPVGYVGADQTTSLSCAKGRENGERNLRREVFYVADIQENLSSAGEHLWKTDEAAKAVVQVLPVARVVMASVHNPLCIHGTSGETGASAGSIFQLWVYTTP